LGVKGTIAGQAKATSDVTINEAGPHALKDKEPCSTGRNDYRTLIGAARLLVNDDGFLGLLNECN
jgi:hypothetical protein